MKLHVSYIIYVVIALAFIACKNDAKSVAVEKSTSADLNVPAKEIEETAKSLIPSNTTEKKEIAETPAAVEEKPASPTPKPKKVAKPQPKPQKVVPSKPAPVKTIKPVAQSQARINFAKTVHEFGEIDEGDKITAKFKFKNTGTGPLTIDDVAVSCGCTMPTYPIVPIAPGETGEIGVIYNSKGKFGTQKPTLTVKTNAVQPLVKLYLNGSIKHVFEKAKTDTTTTEG